VEVVEFYQNYRRNIMYSGKIETENGTISWELIPDKKLIIDGIKCNAEEMTHPDQVVRMVDREISQVKRWWTPKEGWVEYG
jgi:hypothetical protein